jgi:hypothetical protein
MTLPSVFFVLPFREREHYQLLQQAPALATSRSKVVPLSDEKMQTKVLALFAQKPRKKIGRILRQTILLAWRFLQSSKLNGFFDLLPG